MSKKEGKKADPKAASAEEVAPKKAAVVAEGGEPGQVVNLMDDLSKKQAFKKFSWRGKDINQLLAMKIPEFAYIIKK